MSVNFYQGQTDLLQDVKQKSNESSKIDDINEIDDEKVLVSLKIEEIKKRIAEFFNIKNIHFLFGSGTSCNAIPNMHGLYKAVVNNLNKQRKEAQAEDKDLYESICREFCSIHRRVRKNGFYNLEEVLGILYSNRIYLQGYTEKNQELIICEKLIALIENIIFKNLNITFDSEQAEKVLNDYQTFYQKLALRNKDFSRINVFTTNNDLFNETALDKLNIHYINGFGGGLNKFFNPALFNYTFSKRMDISIEKYEPVENMVNLYKIHGSVNWIEDDSNTNTFFKIREISFPEKLTEDERKILIYPTPTKQNKSLGSPYVELFREFQKKLLIPHSVLFIIGYSFSDEHVNNVIYQALATNSTIIVVILNNIEDKDISRNKDNRIFRIWGNIQDNGKETPIHYFDYIVNNLFPSIEASREQETILKDFIEFYNQGILK